MDVKLCLMIRFNETFDKVGWIDLSEILVQFHLQCATAALNMKLEAEKNTVSL